MFFIIGISTQNKLSILFSVHPHELQMYSKLLFIIEIVKLFIGSVSNL